MIIHHVHHSVNCKINRGAWTIYSTGRLGNQMGQYATLYSLAKLNGHKPCILPEMYDALVPLFNITLPVIQEAIALEIPWKIYNLHDWMSPRYYNIRGKYVLLHGYPCSWTFYHHIRNEIHREFTFHDHIKQRVNNYLCKLKGERKKVTFVGIHVRRGDYVNLMPNLWKGVLADKAYLEKAMSYFRTKYKGCLFVVASNGMGWCKKNIDASKGDVHFLDNGNEKLPWKDFSILAHCNHTIMTIGTFGYWVAYLAGGETIYLSNFTLSESKFLNLFREESAFLPEWKGIAANLSALISSNHS
ncbi:galactoside alpha-(1,2)-fucosyltransferase 2-like [Protopterus annectens]|uniref:galactoside alpha-(1,2)-fucosyltransferase 2-like n=1 Tax=Protopterus annectens TaxID=7888 RepID=UPI001CFA4EFA|nr:galactoside alpha-(1,2)-fucosyltransferase 2-like [Protopterus annectens]